MRRLIGIAFDPPSPFPKSAALAGKWAPNPVRSIIVETIAAYMKVQHEVAIEVISLEEQARSLTGNLKAVRQMRKSKEAGFIKRKIEILRRRQLIFRRITDTIVYVICEQYVWFIRRLSLKNKYREINPVNLRKIVEQAEQLSKQNPYTLYLVSDLTTAVQLGDMVEATEGPDFHWHLNIVEMKEGSMNRILGERLAAGDSAEDFREAISDKAAMQAKRMLRQRDRLKGLSDIVHLGKGIDPCTMMPLKAAFEPKQDVPGYQDELRLLIEEAARKGQHLINIDECLILAAVRADLNPEPRLPYAAHSLFHYTHPELPCRLATEQADEELELIKSEPVIDLVENTYRTTWGFPVFSWGTLDRVCDLLTGRICVYAKFNTTAFMKRAECLGIKMGWVTGRRAEILKQSGGTTWIPGSPKASAILVELPDGTRFELLSGWLARIFLEQAKPDTMLGSLLKVGPEVRKAQEEAQKER